MFGPKWPQWQLLFTPGIKKFNAVTSIEPPALFANTFAMAPSRISRPPQIHGNQGYTNIQHLSPRSPYGNTHLPIPPAQFHHVYLHLVLHHSQPKELLPGLPLQLAENLKINATG
jgi:hypothetical protein